jgi:hypothetical protein
MRPGSLMIVLALALTAGVCHAQVRQLETGSALDANYQIGSGGYNEVVGGLGGVNSQLYVTGQVTGLGAFRANVPYSATDQLRLTVPSASQGTFRRQSVGLSDVMGSATPYAAAPYYDRASTVFNAGQIESGLNMLGTPQPPAVSTPAQVSQLYRKVTTDYRPLLRPESAAGKPSLDYQADETAGVLTGTVVPAIAVQPRPGATAMFQLAGLTQRQQLARELYEQAQREEEQAEAQTVVPLPDEGKEVSRDVPEGLKVKTPPPAQRGTIRGGDPNVSGTAKPTEGGVRGEVTRVPASTLPPPNQDVYYDLLVRLNELRDAQSESRSPLSRGQPGGRLAPAGTSMNVPAGTAAPGEWNTVGVTDDSRIILRSFAGEATDTFNTRMARADKLLKQGRYYDAATQYEYALGAATDNPMPRLGLAMALTAAGEPNRAGFQIHRAFRLFPPLMETRLSVPEMVDEKAFRDALAEARARMEQIAAGEGQERQPLLALCVAYMSQALGDEKSAKAAATVLADWAVDDAIMSAYANYVLTGKRPAQSPPASRPAGSLRHSVGWNDRDVDPERLKQHVGLSNKPQPSSAPARPSDTQPAK